MKALLVPGALALLLQAAAADEASPAADTPPQALDVDVALPELGATLEAPEVPSVSALEGEHAARRPLEKAKVRFSIGDVRHARGFRMTRKGCVALDPLDRLRTARLPGKVDGFATCLSLSATADVSAKVRLVLVDPSGREVAAASGMVPFGRLGRQCEYVVEWEGFWVRRPGTYQLHIRLADAVERTVPLVVEAGAE